MFERINKKTNTNILNFKDWPEWYILIEVSFSSIFRVGEGAGELVTLLHILLQS